MVGWKSFCEAGAFLFDEAKVSGWRRLEQPYVLVVCLVRGKQAGAVPGLDGGGVHTEIGGDFGYGEQPFGPSRSRWLGSLLQRRRCNTI